MRSSTQSAKIRLGADCGSDHELLIAKCRLKLKKVRKTIRPFRQDLNQFPYDCTVEVTNRFKGLDLTEFLKNYGERVEKKKCKKTKWLSEEALQRTVNRKDVEGKGEKERYIHLNAVSKNSKER